MNCGDYHRLALSDKLHKPLALATGDRKFHSLVDKVYTRTNLALAWEKVRRNKGAGGVDGEELEQFEARLEENQDRLHQQLKDGIYEPQPVLQHRVPKAGQSGKYRELGIPTIFDRVCQQAMVNRLEPIFEAVFDDANFFPPLSRGSCPERVLGAATLVSQIARNCPSPAVFRASNRSIRLRFWCS